MYFSASQRSYRLPNRIHYQYTHELLLSEINRHSWSNLKADDIVVEQDTVWLYGTVRDEQERRTIVLAARKLPGIRRVESRLTLCVQPFL
jgi:hypothetical protein